jgi:uncharacterized HhH-GPD family protein
MAASTKSGRRAPSTNITIYLAGDETADALLAGDPLALLIGMLLDQQVPMEKAFIGPHVLRERLGHDLDAAEIAAYDPEKFAALFAGPPAIHRFPGSMAKRVQALAAMLVERYDGRAEQVWRDGTGTEVRSRLEALPGFGKQKARIFLALLGKQYAVTADGWPEAAGEYGEPGVFRSVADITDPESLGKVRAYKQQQKAAAKAAKPG